MHAQCMHVHACTAPTVHAHTCKLHTDTCRYMHARQTHTCADCSLCIARTHACQLHTPHMHAQHMHSRCTLHTRAHSTHACTTLACTLNTYTHAQHMHALHTIHTHVQMHLLANCMPAPQHTCMCSTHVRTVCMHAQQTHAHVQRTVRVHAQHTQYAAHTRAQHTCMYSIHACLHNAHGCAAHMHTCVHGTPPYAARVHAQPTRLHAQSAHVLSVHARTPTAHSAHVQTAHACQHPMGLTAEAGWAEAAVGRAAGAACRQGQAATPVQAGSLQAGRALPALPHAPAPQKAVGQIHLLPIDGDLGRGGHTKGGVSIPDPPNPRRGDPGPPCLPLRGPRCPGQAFWQGRGVSHLSNAAPEGGVGWGAQGGFSAPQIKGGA